MIRDAIINEVRAIRDHIAKECDYDVHELFEAFQRLDATSTVAPVSFVPRAGEARPAERPDATDEPQAIPSPHR